ncbi:MAG: hypothetical protein KF901_18085 [Myxococcales bacterium]|nr:hypothetical protein [Myxococcales bacterium]
MLVLAIVGGCGGGELSTTPAMEGDAGLAPEVELEVLRDRAVALDTLGPEALRAGDALLVECAVLDADGERSAWPAEATPSFRFVPESAVARAPDGGWVAVRAGVLHVSCLSDALGLLDEEPLVVRVRASEPIATEATLETLELDAGDAVRAACVAVDAWDNAVELPLSPEAHPSERVTLEGGALRFERAGTYAVSCPHPGAAARPDALTVRPAAPASFTLGVSPRREIYSVGEVVELVAEVHDRFDNLVPGAALDVQAPTGVNRLGERRVTLDAEGRHLVRARVAGMEREVRLDANGEGPRIRCTDPPDASAIVAEPGTRLDVRGVVTDVLGVSALEVDGRSVAIGPAGQWSASIDAGSGVRFVELRARDRGGLESSNVCTYLIAPRYVDPATPIVAAGTIGLSPAAIDDRRSSFTSFGDGLRRVLGHDGNWLRLDAALRRANPLKPRACDQPGPFGTCLASSRIDYLASWVDGPNDAQLTPVAGGLRARVTIPSVRTSLRVDARAAGVPVRSTGEVTIEDIELALTLNVSMQGGRPRVSLREGSETLRIGRVRSSFPGISGALLNTIVRFTESRIRAAVVAALLAELRTQAARSLAGMLADVGAPQVAHRASVPRLDGGSSVLVAGVRPGQLVLDAGGLRLGLDATLRAQPRRAGLPAVGVPVPRHDGAAPLPLPPRRAAIATVSTELLSRAVYALWEAGTFETAVAGARVGNSSSDARASLSMALPPYVEVRDGRAHVALGGVRARVTWPGLLAEPLDVVLGAKASAALRLRGDAFALEAARVDQVVVGSPSIVLAPSVRDALESFLTHIARYFVVEVFVASLPRLPLPRFPISPELRSFGLPAGDLGLVAPSFEVRPHAAILDADLGLLDR